MDRVRQVRWVLGKMNRLGSPIEEHILEVMGGSV